MKMRPKRLLMTGNECYWTINISEANHAYYALSLIDKCSGIIEIHEGLMKDDLRNLICFPDLGEELNCLAFDGQTMIVGGGSGCLSVWDIHHVKPVGKIQAHQGPITCLYVSEDGEFVASGGDDRRVVVWTAKK